MKIAILSRKDDLYSTKRLVESAKQKNHDVKVIDHLKCYMNITSHNPSVHYQGKPLEKFDAVIPRIGASVTFYGTAVVRQFEMMGIYIVNSSDSIIKSRDKLRSLQLLSKEGIGLPITAFAHSPDDTKDLLEIVGGTPIIVKLLESTQGKGVVICETQKASESTIEAFRGLKAYFLVQEFIEESKGCDIRCFVIGERVVASILRTAAEGEFRSNLHKGGTASEIKITPEERAVAVRASKIMGLGVAGVDLLRSKHGPVIMEVNSSPGLEGIEKATKKDIASMIIKYIEKNIEKIRIKEQKKNSANK